MLSWIKFNRRPRNIALLALDFAFMLIVISWAYDVFAWNAKNMCYMLVDDLWGCRLVDLSKFWHMYLLSFSMAITSVLLALVIYMVIISAFCLWAIRFAATIDAGALRFRPVITAFMLGFLILSLDYLVKTESNNQRLPFWWQLIWSRTYAASAIFALLWVNIDTLISIERFETSKKACGK